MPLWQRTRTWLVVAVIVVGLGVAAVVAGARTDAERTPPDDPGAVVMEEADGTPGTTTVAAGRAVVAAPGPRSSTAPTLSQTKPDEVVDDNAYRMAVMDVNGRISEELDELTGLLVLARYDDRAWSTEVTAVLDAMGDSARQARTITAPPAFSQAHATWLEGIDSFEWAAQNLRRAIVGPDEALMRDCIDHIETASTRFKSATGSMAEVDTH